MPCLCGAGIACIGGVSTATSDDWHRCFPAVAAGQCSAADFTAMRHHNIDNIEITLDAGSNVCTVCLIMASHYGADYGAHSGTDRYDIDACFPAGNTTWNTACDDADDALLDRALSDELLAALSDSCMMCYFANQGIQSISPVEFRTMMSARCGMNRPKASSAATATACMAATLLGLLL